MDRKTCLPMPNVVTPIPSPTPHDLPAARLQLARLHTSFTQSASCRATLLTPHQTYRMPLSHPQHYSQHEFDLAHHRGQAPPLPLRLTLQSFVCLCHPARLDRSSKPFIALTQLRLPYHFPCATSSLRYLFCPRLSCLHDFHSDVLRCTLRSHSLLFSERKHDIALRGLTSNLASPQSRALTCVLATFYYPLLSVTLPYYVRPCVAKNERRKGLVLVSTRDSYGSRVRSSSSPFHKREAVPTKPAHNPPLVYFLPALRTLFSPLPPALPQSVQAISNCSTRGAASRTFSCSHPPMHHRNTCRAGEPSGFRPFYISLHH